MGAVRTRSNGLSYPSSGAATVTSAGVHASGAITSLTFDTLPFPLAPGMTPGVKYGMRSETGASCAFRVDATSGAASPFDGAFDNATYSAGAWVAAEIYDPVAFLTSSTASAVVLQQNGGGTNFTINCGFTKGANNPLLSSYLNFACRNSTTDADSDGMADTIGCRREDGTQGWWSAGNFGNFPFGKFVWLGLGMQTNIPRRTLILNGQAASGVAAAGGNPTYHANIDSGWTFTLPAIAGVRWWVVEPESWDGTDWPKATTHFNSPADSDLAFGYPVTFQGSELGAPWSVATSGTVTSDVGKPWANSASGGNCNSERRKVTYGADASGTVYTLTRDIGDLPYNKEGWFTLDFPMIQPRANVIQMTIKGTGGATLFTLAVDAVSNTVSCIINGGSTGTLTFVSLSNRRVQVALHLSSSGAVTLTALVPDTFTGTTSATNNTARSCAVGRWAPQAIGRVTISLAGNNTEVQEFSGLRGWRYWTLTGIDSYSHGETNATVNFDGSTADKAKVPNAWVNSNYPYSCAPDGHQPACVALYRGGPLTHIAATIGRTGHAATLCSTSVLPNLEYTRGAKLFIRGGFPNDTSTASTAALANSVSASMVTAFGRFFDWGARTRNPVIWEQPAKGNSSEMTGGNPEVCFDRAAVLVAREAERYRNTGFVTVIPPALSGLAGLHPTTAEAASFALQTNGARKPIAGKTRFRDRRQNAGRRLSI